MNSSHIILPADEPPKPLRPAFGGWEDYRAWAAHDFMDREKFDVVDIILDDGASIALQINDGKSERRGVVKGSRAFAIVLNEEDAATGVQRLACKIVRKGNRSESSCAVEIEPVTPGAGADPDVSLVRPYVKSPASDERPTDDDGKAAAAAAVDLQVETVVSSVLEADIETVAASDADRRIRVICELPCSVAEIAVQLEASVDDTLDWVADAIGRGLLTVHGGLNASENGRPSLEILRRVREGLQKLSA
jgi:hypothetical protein